MAEDDDAEMDTKVMDSDSSEESDENTEELLQKIQELKWKIEANPYHYDSHKELISLLRTTGDLDAVRKAREAMHEIFPFTEEMWLSWLQDELPLADLPEALSDIRALFEKAVDDYIAPGVWVLFGQFAVDKMYEFEEGTEFPRKVFERAILSCGHHVTKGSLIWDSYRAFEMVILSSMQGMQQEEESDEELVKSIKAQYDRVDKLFKRQLAIPLLGMESTLVEYNEFGSEVMDENKLQTYGMALKKLKEIEPFEKELSMSEVPSLETFREYILYELKCKDLARISCLYERALSVHCLKDDLWLEYLKHLDSSLKVKEIVLSAHHRSVRNCPWSAELWISLVRAIERMGSERDEVIVNFEKALSGNFSTPGDHLRMWMCYCEYKQRAVVDWNAKESLDVKKLRKIFKRAKKSLFDKFGAEGDPKWTLHRYEAQIEARYLGNLDRSRELYEEILKSNSSRAEMWLEYVNLERYHGDKTKCLSLYKRAVDRVYDDAEKVFESFLSFERLEGSLDSVVTAEERICAKREKLERKKEKMAEPREKEMRRRKIKDGRSEENKTERLGRKRQFKDFIKCDDDTPLSGSNNATPTSGKDDGVPSAKRSKASVPESEAMADKATPLSETRPPTVADDVRTVFVSNLPFVTKSSEVQTIFGNCGDIEDVRVVKSKKGKSPKPFAYAYVQFSNKAAVESALLMDRTSFYGRQVYVSPCDSQKKEKVEKPAPRFPSGIDKNTVFVSNLPFSQDEDKVKDLFQQVGTVKQVRMVTHSKGRRKGIAYVEFEEETAASGAVLKLNESLLEGRTISVAISNPPKKGRSTVAMETSGAGRKEMPPPRLIPTAVSRRHTKVQVGSVKPSSSSPAAEEDKDTASVQAGMSNDDFKKLFMKN